MTGAGRWSRITFVSGFLAALVLLVLPAVALLLLAGIALLSVRLGRAMLSALFIGVGAGIVVWLGQARIRCALDTHCTAPDLTVWFVGAALALFAGLLPSALFLGRARRGDPPT